MSHLTNFAGFWKILDCAPVGISINPRGIQGTEFQLNQMGGVTWKIPADAMPTPLFKCNTYEVVPRRSKYFLRFGVYKGHVIECTVKPCDPFLNSITINDGWCLLVCRKLQDIHYETVLELPFSFLPALQDGYFSDLTLKSNNNKRFCVHTCILKLAAPEVDWSSKNNQFSKLPEDVVGAILHFLYAQCLPEGLPEDTVKKVLSAIPDTPGLEFMILACQLYLKNVTVKKKIFSLIADLHMCATQLQEYFSDKDAIVESDWLACNPAKMCFAIKNSIRELAVAASKFLLVCDLYAKTRNELTKETKREILLHAKARVPILMNQLEAFVRSVKLTLLLLLPSQRQQLASYVVQEIETIFDTISPVLIKVKTVLEDILTESETDETFFQKVSETIEHYADKALHKKDTNRLKEVIEVVTGILVHSYHKTENMKLMSNGSKVRSVIKDLDQFITEDFPLFVVWVQELTCTMEEKVDLNDYQFIFKVFVSKVNDFISKMMARKDSLQGVLVNLCELVERDSFTSSLVALGLLETSLYPVADSEEIDQEESWTKETFTQPMPKVYSFSVSPPAYCNRLSEAANELLKSNKETDMIFEIINTGDPENVIQPTADQEVPSSPRQSYSTIAAHRVIVSARCDWFRRALLSGMQESINRKIQVYDTTPQVFSLFLKYLYTGRLDSASLSPDHLSELLLLSDRYELDSLKNECEYALKSHIDVESVVYFLSMADRFNADVLKRACECFIAQHPEVMDHEMFEELPDHLKSKIYDVVICGKLQQANFPQEKKLTRSYNVDDARKSIEEFHINRNTSSVNLPVQVSSRLEGAMGRLREVIGDEMSCSELIQVILAADYDVNRALNFYYSSK